MKKKKKIIIIIIVIIIIMIIDNTLWTHYTIFNFKPVESQLSVFTTPKITYKNFKHKV